MGWVRYFWVWPVVMVLLASASAAESSLPTLDGSSPRARALLLDRIEKAKEDVNRFGGGYVIVGRVVVEKGDDVTLVNSQMRILEGGYFASATKDLIRPVGFRMDQYAPYDLELAGREGDIVDVGDIVMRRLPAEQLVPVKGKIVLQGGEDPRRASVKFSITKGPVNTPSNGTEPRPYWPESFIAEVNADGVIDMNGFSPTEYYCTIEADGFVKKLLRVDFEPNEGADIGTILLEKARRILLEYIVSDNNDFELSDARKMELHGGDFFKATPDIYGWDLQFAQKDGELFFRYSYAPCYISDLGKGELEDFLDTDVGPPKVRPWKLLFNSGHVYLLDQRFWKRLVLFKVTIEQPD